MADRTVRFKVAEDPGEFEQIFRLAYETFVEEIPQHATNADRRHVDRFHADNLYLIAVDGREVVGMIAVRGARPFSLDEKLGSVDPYLPAGRRVCELRLLAVKPTHRHGFVFRGLVGAVVREGRARGFDLAIISGTLRQTKLYRHLGFEPFGPRVGTDAAPFQPMQITFEKFLAAAPPVVSSTEPMSFLPGPVPIAASVRAAFNAPPAYHRGDAFHDTLGRVKRRLCALAGAPRVEVLLGSGTLANDVIAAQLSLFDEPGIVMSNGEFGRRLIDHAARMRIPHAAVETAWGQPLDLAAAAVTARRIGATWLWAVLSETSTGMLNDLNALKALAHDEGLLLCLDCVSAIGAVPVDLDGVYLASGASGKALAAFPGLSFVFYAHDATPAPGRLPRYLDLGSYAEKQGVPFTHSSNLVEALEAALVPFEQDTPFATIAALSDWLRSRLPDLGWAPLVADEAATPAIVTIALPADQPATALGEDLRRQGLLVAHHSEYLARRNWLQVSLMGHESAAPLECLVAALTRLVAARTLTR